MIERHDLRTLAEMGKALWINPRDSRVAMVETLSAVTLMDLTPERAVEKAAAALLERVSGSGGAANFRANLAAGLGIGQPFFRLAPEERFLLVALHLGRWSYGRIARIFGQTPESVETQAWAARLRYASSLPGVAYPTGAPQRGPNCPEYDPQRPWTQRFLDEENSTGRERVFFQNHLMACSSCREALHRCRETYYAIEAVLPRIADDAALGSTSAVTEDGRTLKLLDAVSRRSLTLRLPVDRTFGETFEVFSRRKDVQVALGVLGLVALLALRKIFN